MNNLARAYQQAGRVRDSIELYERTLPKLRTKLGDEHPTTLAAMNGLACSYRLVGNLDRATSLFQATWEGRKAKLGGDHPETLMTILDLADTYMATGQPHKAIPLVRAFLRKAAEIGDRLPAKVQKAVPQGARLLERALQSAGIP